MQQRILMFSGGEASWAAGKRDIQQHGPAGLTLLFCDTMEEDEDTYRFIGDAAANLGIVLTAICDGRRIWDLFRQERMIGNTRADVCSKILKRQLADRWLTENCDPAQTTVLLGYHVEELHRHRRAVTRYAANGWRCESPLCEKPYLTRRQIGDWARQEGLKEQKLYLLGMPHANCGGACVKAGQAHWAHLLKVLPEVYRRWEAEEEATRQYLGKDVAILRDRRGGTTKPLTLRALRLRLEEAQTKKVPLEQVCDPLDWGGCGCFAEDPPESLEE